MKICLLDQKKIIHSCSYCTPNFLKNKFLLWNLCVLTLMPTFRFSSTIVDHETCSLSFPQITSYFFQLQKGIDNKKTSSRWMSVFAKNIYCFWSDSFCLRVLLFVRFRLVVSPLNVAIVPQLLSYSTWVSSAYNWCEISVPFLSLFPV